MRRVIAVAGEPVVIDCPEPTVRPGEVLVDVEYSTISTGTELGILHRSGLPGATNEEYPGNGNIPAAVIRAGVPTGVSPRMAGPDTIALGYSVAGRVREVGAGVKDLGQGDLVACAGSQCAHHAEVVAVPRNLTVPAPAGVTARHAAFVTLGAISMQGVRQTGLAFGETIVVYGLGLLGLLAAQIARAAGMQPIGIDIDEQRFGLARELGVTQLLDGRDPDLRARVRALTEGFGADAVLLSAKTESSQPLNVSFGLCRQHGAVVALGDVGMDVDRDEMWDRTFSQVMAYGPGRYDPEYEEGNVDYPIGLVRWTENRNMAHFLRLVAAGSVQVAPLAPRSWDVDDAAAAYAALRSADRPPTVQLSYGGTGAR